MMIRLGLIRVREKQNLRLTEKFSGKPQTRGRALEESAGHADLRMAHEVGEPEIAADEQIQITQRLVDLLHDAHAQAVRLDVLDGGNEACRAKRVRPATLLGREFHAVEISIQGEVIERGRGFCCEDEADRIRRDFGEIEGHELYAQGSNVIECCTVVTLRRAPTRNLFGLLGIIFDLVERGAQVAYA